MINQISLMLDRQYKLVYKDKVYFGYFGGWDWRNNRYFPIFYHVLDEESKEVHKFAVLVKGWIYELQDFDMKAGEEWI